MYSNTYTLHLEYLPSHSPSETQYGSDSLDEIRAIKRKHQNDESLVRATIYRRLSFADRPAGFIETINGSDFEIVV